MTMSASTPYDHFARFYDLSHDELAEDIPFLLSVTEESGGPVLELGCGSGRLLVPLARAGYAVTGIDNSPEMLARARLRLGGEAPEVRNRVSLVEGDMAVPAVEGGFGLAFFGYNTFMHLDEARAATALRQLKPLLAPGGRLLIDVDNPLLLASAADDPDFVLEDELRDIDGETIRQYTAYESVPGEQAVDVTWVYDRTAAVDDPATRVKVRLRYHYLYPHQIELLLELLGLRLTALYGDYDSSRFNEDSERLIVVARAT